LRGKWDGPWREGERARRRAEVAHGTIEIREIVLSQWEIKKLNGTQI
jgi:hypothetical protein